MGYPIHELWECFFPLMPVRNMAVALIVYDCYFFPYIIFSLCDACSKKPHWKLSKGRRLNMQRLAVQRRMIYRKSTITSVRNWKNMRNQSLEKPKSQRRCAFCRNLFASVDEFVLLSCFVVRIRQKPKQWPVSPFFLLALPLPPRLFLFHFLFIAESCNYIAKI